MNKNGIINIYYHLLNKLVLIDNKVLDSVVITVILVQVATNNKGSI